MFKARPNAKAFFLVFFIHFLLFCLNSLGYQVTENLKDPKYVEIPFLKKTPTTGEAQ